MTDDDTSAADSPPDESVIRRDRYTGGPARSFLSSLAADERIFGADLAVDRAHVVMLAEQDIISDETAGAILEALAAVEADGHGALPEGEDVHEAIETAVIDRVGDAGGRIHTARSRNDEVATCLRYRLRADLLATMEAVLDAREAFLTVAEAHTETLMPGYTHLQPAQPTTVAHWALSYEAALGRETARLEDVYERVNRSPLGAAAFAGTPFNVDRERTAALLGFDGLVTNATDAVASRDVLLETTGHLATLATTLSCCAEDVILYAHRGFIELDDAYASTSSIMPQKKNPDSLELVRAVTGDATAAVTGLQTTLSGLPRAYNRDLQRASPHTWEAIDTVSEATRVTAGAIGTAEWNRAALADAAGEGFATATGVADLLAANGVPFRTAHAVLARAAENGGDQAAIEAAAAELLDDPLEAYVDPGELEAALDPATSVAERDSVGGPAPATVREALKAARRTYQIDHTALADRREALGEAAAALDAAVSEYV